MFYQTQVIKLTRDGVIDVQGKKLSLIGNKIVKVGDYVWTDGKVVFGHTPIRGGGILYNEPSGIPILAQDDLSGNELRGYFSKNGKFKPYLIMSDSWITNSDKKFGHGIETFNNEEIIDAHFADDGDKIIVTNGIFQDSRTLNTTYVWIHVNDTYTFYVDRTHWTLDELKISIDRPFVMGNTLGSENLETVKAPAKIFINDKDEKEIDLEPYAKDVEARALLCAEKIMAQSYTVDDVEANDVTTICGYVKLEELTSDFRSTPSSIRAPEGLVDEPAHPPPDEPFIAYSTAYILTSNSDDKVFEGTIFAAAYGFCFPYIKPRFISNESYYFYNGFPRNKIYEYKCVPFGFSCIFRVENNNVQSEPVAFRDFGGIDSDVTIHADNNYLTYLLGGVDTDIKYVTLLSSRHIKLTTDFPSKDFEDLLPVGDGFYQMNKFGLLSFFNSVREKISENIPVHENFCHVEIEHGEFLTESFSLFLNDTPYLKYKIYTCDNIIQEKQFHFIHSNTGYTVITYDDAGNIIDSFVERPEQEENTFPPVDGYYIKQEDGTFEPLHFTPLFYQFKNGNYLYGVKGGKLYLKSKDGTEQLIGDGLKNFRLQELKTISKAKR